MRSWQVVRLALVGAMVVATSVVVAGAPARGYVASGTSCATGWSAAEVDALFAQGIGPATGFDYAHAYPLPDGRYLWLAQDVFLDIAESGTLAGARFVHNAAFVQDGTCFTLLHGGTPNNPKSFNDGMGAEVPLEHWWWPLGGSVDGPYLRVFWAEMRHNLAYGDTYSGVHYHPVGTWLATYRWADLALESFTPAPDPGGVSRPLYGFAVATDASATYLFGNSYNLDPRSEPLEADRSARRVYLAKVPPGRLDLPPVYWTGSTWSPSAAAARPISDRFSFSNPMQPTFANGRWVSVTKRDDWFGDAVWVETAPAPQGPWTPVEVQQPTVKSGDPTVANTYFATLLPWTEADGRLQYTLSRNAWDADVASQQPWYYRPSVLTAAPPASGPAGPGSSAPKVGLSVRTPVRVLDTRRAGSQQLAPLQVRRISLAGYTATDARGAVVNLTTTGSTGDGWLRAWDCGTVPATSNMNFSAGVDRAATTVVRLDANRGFCVQSLVTTHLVVDLTGAERLSGLRFTPVGPTRVLDTRVGLGRRLRPFEEIAVQVGGQAAALNVTVTEPDRDGWLAVYPCGTKPPTSSANFRAGQVVANHAQVTTTGGSVCLRSMAETHVVVDLLGTFSTSPGGLLLQLATTPARLVDSRIGLAAAPAGSAVVPASSVPAAAAAALVTTTSVGPLASGWLAAAACAPAYGTSTNNFVAGDVAIANLAIVGVDTPACAFTNVRAHKVIDLVGWYVR